MIATQCVTLSVALICIITFNYFPALIQCVECETDTFGQISFAGTHHGPFASIRRSVPVASSMWREMSQASLKKKQQLMLYIFFFIYTHWWFCKTPCILPFSGPLTYCIVTPKHRLGHLDAISPIRAIQTLPIYRSTNGPQCHLPSINRMKSMCVCLFVCVCGKRVHLIAGLMCVSWDDRAVGENSICFRYFFMLHAHWAIH